MGAVILPLMAIYLILLIVGAAYGWRWAKRRGYSTVKRALCAFGGFLIVYLPLMWDWIPTDLAHRYYCKKEAGLWIYKTLDQWKAENPGVFETLVYNKDRPYKVYYDDETGSKSVYFFNERINYSSERKRVFSFLIVKKKIFEIIDSKNNEVLVRYIDFSYNGGSPAIGTGYKIWMSGLNCSNGLVLQNQFFDILNMFEGAKK